MPTTHFSKSISRFRTHPKGPKMTYSAAAKYIKKTVSFVKKWVNRFNETKDIDDLRDSVGKLTPKVEKRIVSLFPRETKLTLRQGAAKLRKSGLNVSYETVRHLRAQTLAALRKSHREAARLSPR